MGEKEDYLTSYRVFFEKFATTVNPEDQLPVQIGGYPINDAELPGEILYWTSQYLTEKECPLTLMTPLQRIILEEVRVAINKQPHEFGYNPDESEYIPLRLMQAVTARVNEVCLRYLDNARLDTLPPPPTDKVLLTTSAATKNSRRSMEDRHVEIGNLESLFGIETTEPTSFYAVYDGHAGSAAASYCAAHLHQYLVESPHYKTDLTQAFSDAFIRTDDEFVRKSNEQNVRGGSTAVAVCVRKRRLHAAWAGDSQALLANRMRLMQLVNPHKPSRQDEQRRINASGGTIMFWGTWRVNGQLAVSRAIGDAKCKPYVTARPEVISVDLDGGEDFVVIACDGLWDFVSEDQVALAVYYQLASAPDNLKAVSKQLVHLAKVKGSQDNISVIVVFLKDPHRIVAENRPPMEIGLDNGLANPPAFSVDSEACKSPAESTPPQNNVLCEDFAVDNGVDDSDSDSEDLGPETAVDVDDVEDSRNSEPAAPTPLVDTVVEEENHIDGALEDNVADSGEDSEDEWNYIKGEGETDKDQGGSEEPDEPPRSETPCQDNSAWETSSVDMNSSPLNPDAPVFIPGVTGGPEVLLAESPFKPLPMDDADQPDMEKFVTGALERPNELLDLDNCDQLNGHHNISLTETTTEHLNGNQKTIETELKLGIDNKDSLIEDLERIQRDTTDFCNIQTTTDSSPLSDDIDHELMERLKSKEADPMSMSFYRDRDDLNAVHDLPDPDDDDGLIADHNNGSIADHNNGSIADHNKENQDPTAEPNNDIFQQNLDTDNIHNYDNVQQEDNRSFGNLNYEAEISNLAIPQTETPESHKLLFEQIPEIPDGKNSELGFSSEDIVDPSEDDRDRVMSPRDESEQDVDMESKDDVPCNPELETIKQEIAENIVAETPHDNDAIVPDVNDTFQLNSNEDIILCDPRFRLISQQVERALGLPSPEHDLCPSLSMKLRPPPVYSEFQEPTGFEGEYPELFRRSHSAASQDLDETSPAPELSQTPVDLLQASEATSPAPDPISPAPEALSPAPEALSPAPEALIPAPETLSPVPKALTPEPEALLPAPEALSMETGASEALSPVPKALTPEPETPSLVPEALSPVPIESMIEHEELTQVPVELTKSPADLSHAPEQLSSPAPVDFLSEAVEAIPAPLISHDNLSSNLCSYSLVEPADDSSKKQSEENKQVINDKVESIEQLIEAKHTEPERTVPESIQRSLIDIETSQSPPLIDTENKPEAQRLQEITPDIVPTKTEIFDAAKAIAQEICVPVTTEASGTNSTPPPTPAVVEPSAPTLETIAAPAPVVKTPTATKTTATKATPKTTGTPRTPASGAKKPLTKPATTAPRATSKPGTPASKPSTPAAKPTPKSATPATRTTPLAKPAPKPLSATTKAPLAAKPAATKPAAARPLTARVPPTKASPPKKEAPVKPTATKPLTTTTKLAAKPAVKTVPSATTKAPLPRPAPRLTRPAPAPAAKKPLTNGDSKPAPRPAPLLAAKKPLTNGDVKSTTRAAPAPARPRPTPRANAAPVTEKSKAVPRPAARAPPRPAGKEKPITKPATTKPPPITKPVPAPVPEPEALPDVIA